MQFEELKLFGGYKLPIFDYEREVKFFLRRKRSILFSYFFYPSKIRAVSVHAVNKF